MATIQKIITNLWFDHQAEEAANYYASIFKDSKVGRITYYGNAGQEIHHRSPGSVMTVEFELEGHQFVALNGGPVFKFNEAMSLVINCKDKEEVDYYWEKLTKGGDPSAQQCGWLKDKYGVSWQVVPTALMDMNADTDEERKDRVMSVMMSMKKLDIETLQQAYKGKVAQPTH